MHDIANPDSFPGHVTSRITSEQSRKHLDSLLRPASIAFVGASTRLNALGNTMVKVAAVDGYDGRIYPVNPKSEIIEGNRCYSDLASLPETVDHVVIGLGDRLAEQALRDAIDHGANAATIFTGCDLSEDGDPRLALRLADMAREAGIQLCGPNSMGFLNPGVGLRVSGFLSTVGLKPGHIALITQSGSAFSALAFNHQRLKFSLCVSTGRELATRSEDYLNWALDQPETRVVGLFLEAARQPEEFMAALAKADRLGVPIVALKVGKTEVSAGFASSHSGAIAGNSAAYEAVFRSHGVIEVETLDEFAACLQLFSNVDARNIPDGALAGIHDSGGEREMVVDLADREGVPYATISETTKTALRANLDSGLQPENPLDAWGSGRDFEQKVEACMDALLADPATAVGVLFQDIRDGSFVAEGFTGAAMRAAAKSVKPMAVVTNYASVSHDETALRVAEAGISVIEGTEEGLRAVKALFSYRDRRATAQTPGPVVAREVIAIWRRRLAEPRDLGEAEALELLRDYGIDVPDVSYCTSEDDVRTAATAVGYPVVLKTAMPGMDHKSDVGGVCLGIADASALMSAYQDMRARLGPRVLIAQMMPKGAEVAFGLVHDPAFGPFVMVAAGGIWIEALDDRVVALPGFDAGQASGMIDALRIRPILDGGRGAAAADLSALCDALSRFSTLAADLGDLISELDVNPLFAHATGTCAVDALVTTRASALASTGKDAK